MARSAESVDHRVGSARKPHKLQTFRWKTARVRKKTPTVLQSIIFHNKKTLLAFIILVFIFCTTKQRHIWAKARSVFGNLFPSFLLVFELLKQSFRSKTISTEEPNPLTLKIIYLFFDISYHIAQFGYFYFCVYVYKIRMVPLLIYLK